MTHRTLAWLAATLVTVTPALAATPGPTAEPSSTHPAPPAELQPGTNPPSLPREVTPPGPPPTVSPSGAPPDVVVVPKS